MSSSVIDYSSSSSDNESDDNLLYNDGDNLNYSSCEELDHTARQSKKRKVNDSQEIIMTDFEFFDLKSDDFHCVKAMLSNWLDGYYDIDLTSISDSICNQVVVGTIVKTDNHAVALATILPLSHQCMIPVNKYLIDRVSSDSKQLLTSGQRIGVLIYERFLNLPWQLIPDIFDSLQKDLLWARQNVGPEYDYDLIVFIARTNPSKKSKNITYLFQEQEMFQKASIQSCSFAAVMHGGGVNTRTQQRTLIVFKRSKLPEIARQMRSVFK